VTKAKRRPGRDPEMETQSHESHSQEEVPVVDVDQAPHTTRHETHAQESQQEGKQEEFKETFDGPKVELNFKGSEILRAKFPKPFEVAEQIASDWVHDGRFEGLPLGHPLAQYFAAKGLRKAKELEKKVMESPVTEKVAMQALTAGMKAQEIINQVRAKVKK
jgi:hypothetical protein